jgi:hypothetical protein
MYKVTNISTIGLGLALGFAWAIGVLIVGIMALIMEPMIVEPFRTLFNIIYPGWGITLGNTLLMTLWSFTHGFVGGFLTGLFYNTLSKNFN